MVHTSQAKPMNLIDILLKNIISSWQYFYEFYIIQACFSLFYYALS